MYYHVGEKFQLLVVELGKLRRVPRKRDGKLMATEESFASIIRDVHPTIWDFRKHISAKPMVKSS